MKIIIIGAGPGGYETAVEAAKRGVEVTLIESGKVGGTCLNEGCIPTKTLCRSAALYSDMKRAAEFGINVGGASDADSEACSESRQNVDEAVAGQAGQKGIATAAGQAGQKGVATAAGQAAGLGVDFAKVQERKNAVVNQLRSGVESLLRNRFITLVHGVAELIDGHTVRVTKCADGTSAQGGFSSSGQNAATAGAGTVGTASAAQNSCEANASENSASTNEVVTEDYTADNIIIATGSHSASLPIPGTDLPGVVNSTSMLEIDHIPERLCIIGAGVIGLEFACIFNSFGSKVTVFEYCPQILPNFDADLAKRLKQSLSKSGIEIITKAAVTGISEAVVGLEVEYKLKDTMLAITADTVLMAVGRRPNIEGLGLDRLGIQYSPKGIMVDDYMRTNVTSVYAIGDVNGQCMLAHAATYQGIKALNNICFDHDTIDLSLVPAVVFTSPEAATVGLTEQECETRGIGYTCLKSFFRANGKAVSQGETDGYIKLLVATEDLAQQAMIEEGYVSGRTSGFGGASILGTMDNGNGGASDAGDMLDGVPRAYLGAAIVNTAARGGSHYTAGQILGCHLFGPHASDLIAEITALIHCKATILDLKSIIHAHPTLSEVFHGLS